MVIKNATERGTVRTVTMWGPGIGRGYSGENREILIRLEANFDHHDGSVL